MSKKDLKDHYDEFTNAAKLRDEAIKVGDSKTANRQYTILKRIFNKAQKDMVSAKEFYERLRNDKDTSVQIAACAYSLALGLDIAEAESILATLSQNTGIGISRLEAEMTLKVWKERGYLKV